jgi:enoyl-CoA hydratase/carnithine racemase
MDLKAFLQGEAPVVEGRGLAGVTEQQPRKPLIAAVEGWALAGGFEIMLACDLAVAAQTARFGVPEVKRGLVAGAGAALRLPERVPLPIALELLLTGDPIDAARAAALGLVNRVTPEGEALAGALELADDAGVRLRGRPGGGAGVRGEAPAGLEGPVAPRVRPGSGAVPAVAHDGGHGRDHRSDDAHRDRSGDGPEPHDVPGEQDEHDAGAHQPEVAALAVHPFEATPAPDL